MDNDETYVGAHIDRETERLAAEVLKAHGLSISDAICLMLDQVADEQRLPFKAKIPNATTLAAMAEVENGGGRRSATVEKLMADLNVDEDTETHEASPRQA